MSEGPVNQNRPQDRLTTTDEKGKRLWVYPQAVSGFFRKRRDWVHAVLIAILVIIPWIDYKGRPLVLLDIVARRFTIFGVTFWSHDTPLLVFLFLIVAISVMFVTSVWGRVWCGWACPQTVFIDAVYRRIEKWFEGDAVVRRRRDNGPLTFEKFARKSGKWIGYFWVSFFISHTFLAYFLGRNELFKMMKSSPSESPTAFLLMGAAVLLTLFDFGWFREQFCTIMCPYGRFQSVLLDDRSMVVYYDIQRGEPRRGIGNVASGTPLGQCIDCLKCVHVCPTGIDIRRGTQMECIACTACIDACDDVMTRLKKPLGLIRYKIDQKRWSRARPYLYLSVLVGLFLGLTFFLSRRESLVVTVIRGIESPYQVTGDSTAPTIINHFKLHLEHHSMELLKLNLRLSDADVAKGIKVVSQLKEYEVAGGANEKVDIFLQFPKSVLNSGRGEVRLFIDQKEQGQTRITEKVIKTVGPL